METLTSSSTKIITKNHINKTLLLSRTLPEPPKTVHVKFQWQKECMFGEQLLLVDSDPSIGSWNSSSAIPLNWSDGHIWTVELDILIELSMQFKFILKRSTGEMLWQPGPDRIFRRWETKNTIIITEDWENDESRKITEELVFNLDLEPILAGNVTHVREEPMPNVKKDVMFADNIAYAEDKPMINSNNECITAGSITSSAELSVKDENTLLGYEEGPVLVPGLTPLQVVSTEDAHSENLRRLSSLMPQLPLMQQGSEMCLR